MARERVATAFRRARLLALVAGLVLAPLAARAQQANTAVIVGTVALLGGQIKVAFTTITDALEPGA